MRCYIYYYNARLLINFRARTELISNANHLTEFVFYYLSDIAQQLLAACITNQHTSRFTSHEKSAALRRSVLFELHDSTAGLFMYVPGDVLSETPQSLESAEIHSWKTLISCGTIILSLVRLKVDRPVKAVSTTQIPKELNKTKKQHLQVCSQSSIVK